jgi:site-specific DNA-methyltransferase (adenine-specific)
MERAGASPTVVVPNIDNTTEAYAALRQANLRFRAEPWPAPYDATLHRLRLGDARDLGWIPADSVHLVVTSPPYWILKEYEPNGRQMGHIANYEEFLDELDKVWSACLRVLAPGGRICCVVGDVCLPRKAAGRHHVVPLHADIQVRTRRLGFDNLTPIIWHKIANGVTEVSGNGAGYYGKPYQPGGVIKNDVELVLLLRKGAKYRSPTPMQRALSLLTKREMQTWFRSIWIDVKGESTRAGHPAPFPVMLAERLVRMFSFAGDTVLDPFGGTGSTTLAAIEAGRNSIYVDIEPRYLAKAANRAQAAALEPRFAGPRSVSVRVE